MAWNWQHPDWPAFRFVPERLTAREARFQRQAGALVATLDDVEAAERDQLVVELMSTEALKTSEIEGELLDRDSVQSSIRRQLGLQTDARRVQPAEEGIARMSADLYRRFAAPLDESTLLAWHRMVMSGRTDLERLGAYRTHSEPMRIVSGAPHSPRVHFEAPPSSAVPGEMGRFLAWFEATAPGASGDLPAITRAGIAHLRFESIHPFEDGNGRIGRAIVEKALAQGSGLPALTSLSRSILMRRRDYYRQLEAASSSLVVDAWLDWFADAVLDAQSHAMAWVKFLLAKARFFEQFGERLNERQTKALLRVTREGPEGFKGGLSAGNYQSITGAPPATARRDLVDLVALGVLRRTGERRGTRYWLALHSAPGSYCEPNPP